MIALVIVACVVALCVLTGPRYCVRRDYVEHQLAGLVRMLEQHDLLDWRPVSDVRLSLPGGMVPVVDVRVGAATKYAVWFTTAPGALRGVVVCRAGTEQAATAALTRLCGHADRVTE